MTTTPDIEAVKARLSLHTTWRDSHGELNDAPNDALAAITDRQARVGEYEKFMEEQVMHSMSLHDQLTASQAEVAQARQERHAFIGNWLTEVAAHDATAAELATLRADLAAHKAAVDDVQELIDSTSDVSHAVACVRSRLRALAEPAKQGEVDALVAAVAWLDPVWLTGAYVKATSPVTAYRIKGWVPLYTAEALAARGLSVKGEWK